MKIAVLPNLSKNNADLYTAKVIDEILNLNSDVLMLTEEGQHFKSYNIEFYSEIDDLVRACDAIITIGGDGTIIHKAKYAAKFSKPILGINLGRVGFVAGLEKTEICEIKRLINGDYNTESRMLLCVTVRCEGKENKFLALNDAVISKDVYSGLVDLDVSLNGRSMNKYVADGIIFSTPTGSTAYSLSAGGPIIEPSFDCILLTPICQHSMFSRPIVFSAGSKIEVRVKTRGTNKAILSIDGEKPRMLSNGSKVSINVEEVKVPLVKIKKHNFYEVLNLKLSERKDKV